MAFFNEVRSTGSAPAVIYINEESISLTEGMYYGKSVSTLVAQYASEFVDVSRITHYSINNQIQHSNTIIQPGDVIRVSVNSESKGWKKINKEGPIMCPSFY